MTVLLIAGSPSEKSRSAGGEGGCGGGGDTRADRFAQEHRPEAIKLIADFSGLDAGVVSLFLQRRPRSPVGLLKPETVLDQQRVADAFARLALIPKPVKVTDIVWLPTLAALPHASSK